jgi:hypothetical protein
MMRTAAQARGGNRMVGRRSVALVAAVVALAVGNLVPAGAGAPPASFNELFSSLPMTVNGSYTPLIGNLDCTPSGGNLAIIWYAPGSASDHRWTNLESTDQGQLEYSTAPLTINGTYGKPFVGDFNADECDDVFWYAPGSGADFVWYGLPDGSFTSRSVTVNGDYSPLVGNWDDSTAGSDVYWYAQAGGTETIWRGTPTPGTFGVSSAPQVSGTAYRVASFGEGILFHRPGPGADYIWEDVIAGSPLPVASIRVVINGTYEPHFSTGILLYGPGLDADRLIIDYEDSGALATLDGTINGSYRVAVPPPGTTLGGLLIFHAPGGAPDHLWVGGAMTAGTAF